MTKYNISEKTFDMDMTEVNRLIKKSVQFDVEGYKTILNERYEDLYSRALNKNDLNNAIRILDQMGKLNGCYVDKQEIDVKDNKFEITFK